MRMPHTIAALALAPRVALAALLAACASGPPKPPPPPPAPAWTPELVARADALEARLVAAPRAAPGELAVRLAFEPRADLDLYVSDPLDETVYYANTPVRSGGVLDADRRCAAHADGVESVRFAAPRAGRYRVGVDFQERCASDERIAPWVVSVDAKGERRLLRGLARWNEFDSRIDEFVVD
jgi:hypothetical protein